MAHLCEEITDLSFYPRQVPLLQDRRPDCTNLLRSTKVDETKKKSACVILTNKGLLLLRFYSLRLRLLVQMCLVFPG
ncbi:Uncharacterized protein APZ42_006748 [Daphnia magna]|uniref:Uncharacterized protein n=1 Tax=Daphnia magna TaxID=35525 RepID=A0A164FQ89_9CRUS|nr:Uncharacterized protein APZ42_006748 [Daphnia magna]